MASRNPSFVYLLHPLSFCFWLLFPAPLAVRNSFTLSSASTTSSSTGVVIAGAFLIISDAEDEVWNLRSVTRCADSVVVWVLWMGMGPPADDDEVDEVMVCFSTLYSVVRVLRRISSYVCITDFSTTILCDNSITFCTFSERVICGRMWKGLWVTKGVAWETCNNTLYLGLEGERVERTWRWLVIDNLNTPAVHHHHRRPINLVHQLRNALPFVAAAPAETPSQIVSWTNDSLCHL